MPHGAGTFLGRRPVPRHLNPAGWWRGRYADSLLRAESRRPQIHLANRVPSGNRASGHSVIHTYVFGSVATLEGALWSSVTLVDLLAPTR